MSGGRLLLRRMAGYACTAGAAAVVDAGGFALLLRVAVPLALAATLSFSVAVVVNYVLTSRFVFGRRLTLAGFGLFVSAALVGLAFNVGVTLLAATQAGVPPVLAKVIGIGTAFLFNFALNAGVVYRRRG